MQINNNNNENVTNNIYYIEDSKLAKNRRKKQDQGSGCAFLLVIVLIGLAIQYWQISVGIGLVTAIGVTVWLVHRQHKRNAAAEQASALKEFPTDTVLYELDGTMVQVGEIAPQGGRYVRLQDFAGPQTVMSVEYLRGLARSRPTAP